jgi:hypothetical protein
MDHAQRDGPRSDRGPDPAVAAAVDVLGWSGSSALPAQTLLGCRLVPVVRLEVEAHASRQAHGDGPQLDLDVLSTWEWPGAEPHAPPPALSLTGVLFHAHGRWRRACITASYWRRFGAAAVIAPTPEVVDEISRLEFALQGVGLVTTDDASDSAQLIVPAEPGRRPPERRQIAHRWLEELLYRDALQRGLYPQPGPL